MSHVGAWGTEHDHQVTVFQWAAIHAQRRPELALLFAIPNGGDRNAVVAAKLKAEGVRRGVPDIFLAVPKGTMHGLFIELKVAGRRLSADQTRWFAQLGEMGYCVVKCDGCDEAIKTIEDYLDVED